MKTIKKNKNIIITTIISLLIMAIICFIVYKLSGNIFTNPKNLKQQLNTYGNWGKVILTLAMTLQVIFVFLPGEVIEIAAGFTYGTFQGLLICSIGAIIGTIFIYYFVNHLGIKLINKFFDTNKINEIRFLKKEKNLKVILFIIFFIPGTPKDLITYFAPFTKIPLSSFLIITSIARIPSIITSTIGGDALSCQNYHFTLIVFITTTIISLIGLIFYKHYIKQKNL